MGHETLLSLAVAIPLCPLLAFFIIVFGSSRMPRPASAWIALGAMALAFLLMLAVDLGWLLRLQSGQATPFDASWVWLNLGPTGQVGSPGNVSLDWGYMVDSATAVLLFVVTAVGTLIFWFAMGYMEGDRWYPRFFAYFSLFAAAMLGVVISNTLLWFFICWEIMGLCSYFLIGFWYEKPSAMRAAKKAFVVTRVGDVGFFIGILVVYYATTSHTLTFSQIFAPAELAHLSSLRWPALTTIALLVFCGSVGKSAQFPLHVWLPDAMEGPTPVSALIHAATMVAAGVFLVARMYPVFAYPATHNLPPVALQVVAGIGAFTAVFAATMGIPHFDVKKVLAYSTISQLGYMFMSLGSFGWSPALFHLMTHAWFKALLFLGSGSIFHATHTYDMRQMGGLLKKMPRTGWTFLMGCLALCGLFPFSGFWSKDAILGEAWRASDPYYRIVFALGMLGALMTAFYTMRMFFLIFMGEPRDHHIYDHAHESPPVMTIPLVILAVGAIFIGLVGIPVEAYNVFGSVVKFAEDFPQSGPENGLVTVILMILSTLIVALGIWLAARCYYWKTARAPEDGGLGRRTFWDNAYRSAAHLWYVDEFYMDLLVNPTMSFSSSMGTLDDLLVDRLFVDGSARVAVWLSLINDWVDRNIIDGIVRMVGTVNERAGDALRHVQQGVIQVYALIVFCSIFVLILLVRYIH